MENATTVFWDVFKGDMTSLREKQILNCHPIPRTSIGYWIRTWFTCGQFDDGTDGMFSKET